MGLKKLGPTAAPVAGRLLELLRDQTVTNRHSDAGVAFSKDMPPAAPNRIRQLVIEALGAMGPAAAEAVPILEEIQNADRQPWEVRTTADAALKNIRGSAGPESDQSGR